MLSMLCSNARTALGVRQVARLPRVRVRVRVRTDTSNKTSVRDGSVRTQSTTTPPSQRQQSTAFVTDASSVAQEPTMRGRPLFQQVRESLTSVLLKPRTVPIPRWISPTHYTITLSECFGHSSFILVAASYAVDDFLQLRIIAVAGSTAMLFFTYFHPHGRVLWLPFKWNALFIAINCYRIGKVYLDRFFAHKLGDEILRIRDDHFYVLDPVDFAKLVRSGTEQTFQPGDLVVSQSCPNRYIRLVVSGQLMAVRDGVPTYTLEEGNFVSEAGLHAGLMLRGRVESCCSIVAKTPTHVITWERTELMNLLQREKLLRRSLKAALSWDIVRKLKGQREILAMGKIENPELWTQKRNEQTHDRYAAILQNMLMHPQYLHERRDELNKYRMIHHIDDEHHTMALKKCGWTLEEFEAGHKDGMKDSLDEDEDEDDSIKRDWKRWARDVYFRVFG